MNKNFKKSISIEKWNRISRILAFFVSIAIWWVSITFSVQGFNFTVPGMSWIGWTLGACVTVIEIVFNKPGIRRNLTLWIVGALAYLYGMYTNIAGIWIAQGSIAGFGHLVFPIILGSVLEWIPEVLFVWAILGVVTQEGDFIGNVVKMFSGEKDDDDYDDGKSPVSKHKNLINDNNWNSSNQNYSRPKPKTIVHPPLRRGGGSFDGDDLGISMDSFLNSKPFIAKPRR